MPIPSSLENALAAIAPFVFPTGEELGGLYPAVAVPSLSTALTLLLGIIILSRLGITVLRIIGRVFLAVLRATLAASVTAWRSIRDRWYGALKRALHRVIAIQRNRSRSSKTHGRVSSSSFESWEDLSQRYKMWERGGRITAEIEQAFMILGVTPLATDNEIRKAYLRLMKRYHPDRSIHAPPEERERLQNATIRIRQAYDTLTERLCQAP